MIITPKVVIGNPDWPDTPGGPTPNPGVPTPPAGPTPPKPIGDFVGGTPGGFAPHPGQGHQTGPVAFPPDVVGRVPEGPLRYANGDPLAIVQFGDAGRAIELLASGTENPNLVSVQDSLRGALKVAFNRSASGDAQAIIHKDGSPSYWIASLSDEDGNAIRIDGERVKAQREQADMIAIVGKKDVINFTDLPVHKPHWWDFILG